MSLLKDLTGQTIGNWEVIKRGDGTKQTRWVCRCKLCGDIHNVFSTNLVRGMTTNCKNCKGIRFRRDGENVSITLMYHRLKTRAKKKVREFSITKENMLELLIKQDYKCSLTGLDIFLAKTRYDFINGKSTASLDRIDNDIGYNINNIQWVHKKVNQMKSDSSTEEFLKICRLICKNHPEEIK